MSVRRRGAVSTSETPLFPAATLARCRSIAAETLCEAPTSCLTVTRRASVAVAEEGDSTGFEEVTRGRVEEEKVEVEVEVEVREEVSVESEEARSVMAERCVMRVSMLENEESKGEKVRMWERGGYAISDGRAPSVEERRGKANVPSDECRRPFQPFPRFDQQPIRMRPLARQPRQETLRVPLDPCRRCDDPLPSFVKSLSDLLESLP